MILQPPDDAMLAKLRATYAAGEATPRQRAAAHATAQRIRDGHSFSEKAR